jgi:hypothetical protein
MSPAVYYNAIKFWTHSLSSQICSCGALKELTQMQETELIFNSLLGLNDSYTSIHSQIISMDPLLMSERYIPSYIKN